MLTSLVTQIRRIFTGAFVLLFLLFVATHCRAGSVSGTIQNASGVGLKNGTITFNLSQPAYKGDGSASIVPTTVSCYTDINGAVTGVPNPTALPVLTPTTGVGSLAAGTYYFKFTYYNLAAGTETMPSPEQSVVLSATGEITETLPVLQPAGATGIKIYIGTSAGTETLQATQPFASGNYIQSIAVNTNSAPPASNTTVCSLVFNDAMVPTYLTYRVNILDANGNQIAGYPNNFYFDTANVNLGTMTPARNLRAQFPSAIVANPTGGGVQSINSPLAVLGLFSPNQIKVVGAGTTQMGSTTVGALPPAGSNIFAEVGVTDSTAVAAEGQTCVGGSSNKAVAISNGTVWKCF